MDQKAEKYTILLEYPDKTRLVPVSSPGINFMEGYYLTGTIESAKHGQKIFSKSKRQWCYSLPITSSLYTENLLHKTQILYAPDIANILLELDIKPGVKVVECGTGSGSLSVSFANRIGPKGRLYTYEFNESRANQARKQFEMLGLDGRITLTHRDVLTYGFELDSQESLEVDAVFLDLPSPEQAVEPATRVLKYWGRLCNFSPCVEQVQAVVAQMEKLGYVNIDTIQVLNRQFGEVQHGYQQIGGESYRNKRQTQKEQKLVVPSPQGPPERQKPYVAPVESTRGHTGYLTFGTKCYI